MRHRIVLTTTWRRLCCRFFCTLLTCLAVVQALPPTRAVAADDILMKAMRDELARSMAKLQIEKLEKPYFIAYRIQESDSTRAAASFGSLLSSGTDRSRVLSVELRAGDYALDNTNFLAMPSGPSGMNRGFATLPLEDNYQELRRQIWLATDAAYKKAVEDLGKKRAVLQNRTRTEEIPDFSKEQPTTTNDLAPTAVVNRADAERLVKDLSAIFKEMPQVFTSTVSLQVINVRRLYVNNEGSSYTRTASLVSFAALAATQAVDGMPLEDFVTAYGRALDDLPKKEELASGIRNMGAGLAKLREAPLLDRYNGPVLFEGQAAAELFSQAFAPRLLAARRPLSDNPSFERAAGQFENPFLDKLGSRVLPEFLTVVDDPTRFQFQSSPLAGAYRVDEDGVPARETKLVDKGILKTLLATRNPVRGIAQSTGNRRGAGATPGNLFLTAEKGLGDQEIKEQLLKLIRQRGKEYGIVVRRMGNPVLKAARDLAPGLGTSSGAEETPVESAVLAYKMFPDGHEELIRNAALSGVSAAGFKDIVAASTAQTVYSAPFSSRAAYSFSYSPLDAGTFIVSFVVPALLFEDLTVTRPRGQIPKPPVAQHPFFDKK